MSQPKDAHMDASPQERIPAKPAIHMTRAPSSDPFCSFNTARPVPPTIPTATIHIPHACIVTSFGFVSQYPEEMRGGHFRIFSRFFVPRLRRSRAYLRDRATERSPRSLLDRAAGSSTSRNSGRPFPGQFSWGGTAAPPSGMSRGTVSQCRPPAGCDTVESVVRHGKGRDDGSGRDRDVRGRARSLLAAVDAS